LLIRFSTRTWKSKLKEWKYDKYSTGKDKSIIISNVEEGERAEERITVTYPLQYDRFLTLKNDWSLFFVAHSAGLVRISVSNVPDEWKGEDMAEFPLRKALWQALWERLYHSEIYPWCVSCLKAIGAEIRFGEYQITEPRS
jgi:hypothetical protein